MAGDTLSQVVPTPPGKPEEHDRIALLKSRAQDHTEVASGFWGQYDGMVMFECYFVVSAVRQGFLRGE